MKKLVLFTVMLIGSGQLHAQLCAANVTLTTSEISTPVVHQAVKKIIASTNYDVSPGYNSTLRAGILIELKANTHIKTGSLFLAEIGECTNSGAIVKDVSNAGKESLTLYPNPVKSTFTVSSSQSDISHVVITSLEGRIIMSVNVKDQKGLQLDISNYPPGTYLLTVETEDGKVFKEKVFKN